MDKNATPLTAEPGMTARGYAKRVTHLRSLAVGNIEAEFQQAMDQAHAEGFKAGIEAAAKHLEYGVVCYDTNAREYRRILKQEKHQDGAIYEAIVNENINTIRALADKEGGA